MINLLEGRNKVYTILFSILILAVSVAVKSIIVLYATPSRVERELNKVYEEVADNYPFSRRPAEFLIKWGEYRDSDECSNAVYQSIFGSGFEGNVYVVTYPDSIEFPGLPTIRRQFRIEKLME